MSPTAYLMLAILFLSAITFGDAAVVVGRHETGGMGGAGSQIGGQVAGGVGMSFGVESGVSGNVAGRAAAGQGGYSRTGMSIAGI